MKTTETIEIGDWLRPYYDEVVQEQRASKINKVRGGFFGVTLVAALVMGDDYFHDQAMASNMANHPCQEDSSLSPKLQEIKAGYCINERQGKVALVAFGMSPERAENLASQAEIEVATATNNELQPDFVPVMPPDSLVTTVFAGNPKCELMDFNGNNGAVAADREMNLHDSYSFIISTSPLEGCSPEIKGKARATKEGPGIYAIVNDVNAPDQSLTSKIVAHEYLHLAGLGHAGSIYYWPKQLGSIDGSPDLMRVSENGSINLTDLLEMSTYEAYGENSNIMGNEFNGSDVLVPNALQMHTLEWPDRVRDDAPDLAVDLENGTVELDLNDSRFGFLKLETPLELCSEGSISPYKFDSLAIVPADKFEYDSPTRRQGVDLYLARNDSHLLSTMNLGMISLTPSETHLEQTVTAGDLRINITIDRESGKISLKTSQ